MKKFWVAFWMLLAITAVFRCHYDYLGRGWWTDDFAFLHGTGGVATRPHALVDWLGFWNPWRGWFYRPVFLNYWAIFQTLGLARPEIMHGAGLVLHGLVVGLWGLLTYRLTRQPAVGVLAGAAFLFWPGKEEAIWWISSHSTLLATLFSILALHSWLSWRRNGTRIHFAGALLAFWLACCSKSDAISLLFAMPLIDYVAGKFAWEKRILIPYLPFLGLWIIYGYCEWSAARYYASGDPYLISMLTMSLSQRFSFVPTVTEICSLGLFPVKQPMALVLLGAATVCFLYRDHLRWDETHQVQRRVFVWALSWFILSVFPVTLAAGRHAGGSRFHYFPMLSASLAATILAVTAFTFLQSTLKEAFVSRRFEPRLNASEIGSLAILVWTLPVAAALWWSQPSLETQWMIYTGAGVFVLFLFWKRSCEWVVPATLFLVIGVQQFVMLSESDSGETWRWGIVGLCGLLQGRRALPGAFLALALWESPIIGMSLILSYVLAKELAVQTQFRRESPAERFCAGNRA